MKITDELIDELAHLARLEFTPGDKTGLKVDLERMINFFEKLNEVNTDGIEPLLHMSPRMNVLREDEVQGSINREEALLNAPAKNEAFFLVPKVIKK
jgi:aspartyl-tRNA(Asn)/glutamyl-tRNA(Gln) amidotransferase subunit C